MTGRATSIAFLGPEGTFTEEALRSEPDYREAAIEPRPTIVEVFEAVQSGEVALGFIPVENAIDGTVRDTLDALVMDFKLLIQREVVLDIHLHLMAATGTELAQVRRVLSFPVALAQCRKYVAARLPTATSVAANSTAEAARQVGEHGTAGDAAIAPRLAAELYGLSILAEDVEDYPGNQTRFIAVSRTGIPAPTGHDRTSIVCYQRSDRPGSLHGILGQFAARNINLTKLESRPTKLGLGDYCFVIDLDGHVADEVVADCLRTLHAELAGVKFLGSYPAAGIHARSRRRRVSQAWKQADEWMSELRTQIG
ncbi:MAG: prephenate dehydratase [Acidimicrobiales bacterium]